MSSSPSILILLSLLSTPILALPLPSTPNLAHPTDSLCSDSTVSWAKKIDQNCPVCSDNNFPDDLRVPYCLKGQQTNPAKVLPTVPVVWRRHAYDSSKKEDKRDDVLDDVLRLIKHTPSIELPPAPVVWRRHVEDSSRNYEKREEDILDKLNQFIRHTPSVVIPPAQEVWRRHAIDTSTKPEKRQDRGPVRDTNPSLVLPPAPVIWRRHADESSKKQDRRDDVLEGRVIKHPYPIELPTAPVVWIDSPKKAEKRQDLPVVPDDDLNGIITLGPGIVLPLEQEVYRRRHAIDTPNKEEEKRQDGLDHSSDHFKPNPSIVLPPDGGLYRRQARDTATPPDEKEESGKQASTAPSVEMMGSAFDETILQPAPGIYKGV